MQCIHIICYPPDMAEGAFIELDIWADPVLFLEACARLKEGPRSRVVRNCRNCITLALRPGGNYGNLLQHHGRHATNQIFGFYDLLFTRFAVVSAHSVWAMFDLRDGSFEANTVAEPCSKRICQPLVSTFKAKNFGREKGHLPQFQNGGMP